MTWLCHQTRQQAFFISIVFSQCSVAGQNIVMQCMNEYFICKIFMTSCLSPQKLRCFMYALFLLSFIAEWAELDLLPTVAHRARLKDKRKSFYLQQKLILCACQCRQVGEGLGQVLVFSSYGWMVGRQVKRQIDIGIVRFSSSSWTGTQYVDQADLIQKALSGSLF